MDPRRNIGAPSKQPQLSQSGQEANKDEEWWHSESSDDEDEWEEGVQQREPDELHDPAADDQDLDWAHRQRQGRKTDAILSCPCCFATLCIDCQKHALVHGQYRAMFTMNCRIDKEQLMEQLSSKRGGRSRGKQARTGEVEAMWRVLCEVCDTLVGAQDEDEVVHFFHVLSSNA